MTKNWLVDGISIAREIKASGLHSKHKLRDNGANSECSKCTCGIDNCNESNKWLGLPSGVKFDPSDIEVLGHLAAKRGIGSAKPQPFIDVFIPTLDVEEGICSKHPQDLPGSRTDGNSFHFFSKTTKAYTTGQRKRRKICNESLNVRWHKTGQTKPILKNGSRIGFKKILVLYETVGGGSKARKLDWVMHQYHIGPDEEEKDGEYVVSKIFYHVQKQQINVRVVVKESDTTPGTPMTDAPHPPRPGNTPVFEDYTCDYVPQPTQDSEYIEQKYHPPLSRVELQDDGEGDSQAIDLDTFDNSFLRADNPSTIDTAGSTSHTSLGTTSPLLADLYFPAEDGLNGWLDRL